MTLLWLLSIFLTLGAGVCAASSSCAKEQGYPARAQNLAESAIALGALAIASGVAAVWLR
jgi:hypothetical protein